MTQATHRIPSDAVQVVFAWRPTFDEAGHSLEEVSELISRRRCTPSEWEELVKDCYAAKWLNELLTGKPLTDSMGMTSLFQCGRCDEFWGIDTEIHDVNSDITVTRCLNCGAISTYDLEKLEFTAVMDGFLMGMSPCA